MVNFSKELVSNCHNTVHGNSNIQKPKMVGENMVSVISGNEKLQKCE